MTKPTTPRGLRTPGRSLWCRITTAYDLREDEFAVLEHACRTADTIARLDAELVGAPLTVPGSAGQLREHPLLSEARQQRALLGRLLHQLKLPDSDEVAYVRAGRRSAQARAAASSRWSKAYG